MTKEQDARSKAMMITRRCIWTVLSLVCAFIRAATAQEDSVYYHKGGQELREGKYKEAIDDYTKALSVNPNMVDAYYARAICYTSSSKKKEAVNDLQTILKKDSLYANAYNFLGLISYNKNEYDQALGYYNKALKIDPENAEAYGNRGNLYTYRKEYSKAESDYQKAIQWSKENELERHYVNLGWLYYIQKQYSKAVDYASKVIDKLDPECKEAYELRMKAYLELNEYDKSEADREKYKKLKFSKTLCPECGPK